MAALPGDPRARSSPARSAPARPSAPAVTAYAVWEARAYTLRSVELPVLPTGRRPLRVLHLSDLHLTPGQSRKREWLRSLADLEPDLVVNTGDNLAHVDALPPLLDALGPLLDVPGVFVLGSNDYFAPILRNPLCATSSPTTARAGRHTTKLPWRELADAFSAAGWTDLTNRRTTTHRRRPDRGVGRRRRPAPGLRRPRRGRRPGRPPTPTCGSRSPTRRTCGCSTSSPPTATTRSSPATPTAVRSRLPLRGALVTNCDLEPARAKGLHRHPADSRPGDPGSSWLHVSAGLGTSPYFPIRSACRPEATLLTLTPTTDSRALEPPTDSERPPLGSCRAVAPGPVSSRRAIGLWRSLVARLVRDEEAAGSNPVSPTTTPADHGCLR